MHCSSNIHEILSSSQENNITFHFAIERISVTPNDDLSVSYGVHEYEYGNTNLVDQESSGVSISYTMGSISSSGALNETDNVGGESATQEDGYYVSMGFSF